MKEPREWRRVLTRSRFVSLFVDRELTGDGLTFTVHSDGRMTGRVGEASLSGSWIWRHSLFCRSASLDGESLGMDCEVVEEWDGRMRYTRNGGRGEASIVTVRR